MVEFANSEQLTPLDLLMPKVYITALLTFPSSETTVNLSSALQHGLEKLSNQVPWISGRVFPSRSHDNRPVLKMCWNTDTSPQLIDKGCIDQSYKGIAASNMPVKAFHPRLLPISVMTELNPIEKGAPVLAASFFRFGDTSGLGLYISMHHSVVDATGFSKIVELLAQNVADVESPPLHISNRVQRLSHALSPDLDSISSASLDTLYDSHPEFSPSPPVFPSEFPPCTSKMFAMPIAKIDTLKHRLAGVLSIPPTTNTILCALIWSAITRARIQRDKTLPEKSSQLVMAVNGRGRIEEFANSKDPYFGNLVTYSLARSLATSLSSASDLQNIDHLSEVCRAIAESQSAARINSRHIAEVYRLAEGVEDYKSIFVGWDLFRSTDLTITSWSDLDFYNMDFGAKLGKPEFLRLPFMDADGVGIVFPRRRLENEVLEVMVMLRSDDMEVLENCGIFDPLG